MAIVALLLTIIVSIPITINNESLRFNCTKVAVRVISHFSSNTTINSLQCNAISSYVATDGQSASSSWCRTLFETDDQILISLRESYFLTSPLRLPQPGGPGPHTHIPHEQGGPAKIRSHVTIDGQSVSMSWCRVHAALDGLYSNEF
jgi:hypothetical protein